LGPGDRFGHGTRMSDPEPRPLPEPEPPLRDGLVSLRHYRADDAEAIVRACSDPETVRWIPMIPNPYTLADAEGFIERTADAWQAGRAAVFAIADAGDDALLGSIGLQDPHGQRAFVGYWVAPWARGRGVASAALRLVSRWGLRDLGIVRLALYTLPGNVASQTVAERAGFRPEGVLRNYVDDRGTPTDAVMFSLVPGDIAGE
jgi:RimJ/RimL family protein N-acetyltransferase